METFDEVSFYESSLDLDFDKNLLFDDSVTLSENREVLEKFNYNSLSYKNKLKHAFGFFYS